MALHGQAPLLIILKEVATATQVTQDVVEAAVQVKQVYEQPYHYKIFKLLHVALVPSSKYLSLHRQVGLLKVLNEVDGHAVQPFDVESVHVEQE